MSRGPLVGVRPRRPAVLRHPLRVGRRPLPVLVGRLPPTPGRGSVGRAGGPVRRPASGAVCGTPAAAVRVLGTPTCTPRVLGTPAAAEC